MTTPKAVTWVETDADLRAQIDRQIARLEQVERIAKLDMQRLLDPPEAQYPHIDGGFPFSPTLGTYWPKGYERMTGGILRKGRGYR